MECASGEQAVECISIAEGKEMEFGDMEKKVMEIRAKSDIIRVLDDKLQKERII